MTDEFSRRDILDQVASGTVDPATETSRSGDRFNVGIEPGVSAADADAVAAEAETVDRRMDFGEIGTVITGRFPERARERLRADAKVRYVERDGTVHKLAQTLPWGIDRIDADVLHEDGRTGSGATVAVLDTGIDDDHPDLPTPVDGKCFTSNCCGEANCDNGNACNYNWSDDDDHGTHVAGTVAAVDNTEGVIGVGPSVDIMAGKVLTGCGSGSWSSVSSGIEWATDNGADVINMSLGASSGSSTLRDACQYAVDNNVVVVAAAGNAGPCSDCVVYPAAYDTVIAVSATSEDDSLASFSSTGPEVELAAPGEGVYSTVANDTNDYKYFSGTSMASPHVAGIAAMVKAETDLSDNQAIRDRLNATAEDIGLGTNEQGNGLVDATAGVLFVQDWSFEVGSRIQYSSAAVNGARVFVGSLDSTLYALDRTDGSVDWSLDRNGALADSSPTLDGGRVYVGSGGGTLYALDEATGTEDWSYDTDSAMVSSPTVDSDVVCVGTNDGRVLALDDTSSGAELWSTDVGAPVFSTPAIDGSSVYVTTNDGDVVALDTATGAEQWRVETGAEIGHGSPTVANGSVYVAADDVYALDPTDGTEFWRQSTYDGTAGSTPTYDATTDRVVVGDAGGTVYSLDPNNSGSIDWTYTTGGAVGATPVLATDHVVVGADDGGVYLLDAADGSELSQRTVGQLRAAASVDSDVAFLGTWDGTIVALANVTG